MNFARKLLLRVSQRLDLPGEVAAALPCIVMNGFTECSMDCHRGLLEYEKNAIVVALNIGAVRVEGTVLEVRLMHRDRLTVTGQIHAVQFLEGSG